MRWIKHQLRDNLSLRGQRALRNLLAWRPIIDFPPDVRRTVFLAGTARGGTGWVANIINSNNDYRYMYEPFNPTQLCTQFFSVGRYVRPDDTDTEALEVARRRLTGRIGYDVSRDRLNRRFIAHRRLIKDVRSHLWLKWLHTNFPGVKYILLFRHPCAVVNSRMKLGFDIHLEPYLSQPNLMEDYLSPFKAELEDACNLPEWDQRVFAWAIQHYVPLRQFAKNEIHLAFYENFSEKTEGEVQRLADFIGDQLNEGVHESLKRPAFFTQPGAPILTGRSVAAGWKDEVTEQQTRRAIDILSLFGLDKIYGADALPNVDAAYAQLGSEMLQTVQR